MLKHEINTPEVWKSLVPVKADEGHKYCYGHTLIYGAPELTGATRLAAEACARVGSGLVSVLAPKGVSSIYRASLPAHVLVRDDLSWDSPRVTAKIYGPGGLVKKPNFHLSVPVVLDADTLNDLSKELSQNYILTPHEGEFRRAFPGITGAPKERALSAARNSNAHIVLKGARTVIAAPDGRYIINTHASPYLATAGTGDVLAGMIAGLAAQNMPIFEACCAAVWLHGEASLRLGMGLVASDLPDTIPSVLKEALKR